MYYYVVEKDGKIDSFGCCNSKKVLLEKIELLELCGAKVKLVSKWEWNKKKRSILVSNAKARERFYKIIRRDLKCVNMS
ncbi:hypothetical protein KKP97_05305 [Methanothermococcus sp. SCGC AD-155-C09]|nr:hypothetical protein [Methanothermococcus sp. SCGC AD-155-C09]